MKNSKRGTTLIETAIVLAIIATMGTILPPLTGKLKSLITQTSTSSHDAALVMEKLISVLTNARQILYPRATNGASRGKILVFLDENNVLSAITCNGKQLTLRQHVVAEKIDQKSLGQCDAILFHDRGKTRRCLRIRIQKGGFLAATTVPFINTPDSCRLLKRETRGCQ